MPQIVWEMWVSASDERVCAACAARNGQLYRQGEGPHPPVHPFCRCKRVPAFVQTVEDPASAPGQGGQPVDVEDLLPPPDPEMPAPPPQPPRWPPIFWWPEPWEREPDPEEEE